MSDNILESYFIKVGALPDTASFTRLAYIIKDSTRLIDTFAGQTIKDVVAIQGATVAAFSAIGIGMISLADKTAMTDQSYRLLGMRMLMNKSSARAMQNALDELGATIDEVAYDPELNKRFQYLYEQNIGLGKLMGKNFDQNMRSIRDLRMQYKMFGTEFEYLVGGVVSKAFEKLGFSTGETEDQLDRLNRWFTDHIPEMADATATFLVPIWKDMKIVLADTADNAKTAAGDFTFLIGVLSGDTSIQNTTFDVENLAKAFQHVANGAAEAAVGTSFLFKTLGHVGMAGVDLAAEAVQNSVFNSQGAEKYQGLAKDEAGKAFRNIYDLIADPKDMLGRSDKLDNPDFAAMNKLAIHVAGKDSSDSSSSNVGDIITQAAQKYGIDPLLFSAMIKNESSFDPNAVSNKGAKGLGQLMPGTAKAYGVSNPFNASQNADGSAHYFSDLIKKYGNSRAALAAYNEGETNYDKRGYGNLPAETKSYVDSIMGDFRSAQSGHTSIGPVTIQVPHALPEDKWADFVHQSMHDLTVKNTRNVTAQTAGGAYW